MAGQPSFYQQVNQGERFFEFTTQTFLTSQHSETMYHGAPHLSDEDDSQFCSIGQVFLTTYIANKCRVFDQHQSCKLNAPVPFEVKDMEGSALILYLEPVPVGGVELYKRHLCQGESIVLQDFETLRLGAHQLLRYHSIPENKAAEVGEPVIITSSAKVNGTQGPAIVYMSADGSGPLALRIMCTSEVQAPKSLGPYRVETQTWVMMLNKVISAQKVDTYRLEKEETGISVVVCDSLVDDGGNFKKETSESHITSTGYITCLLSALEGVLAEEDISATLFLDFFGVLVVSLLRKKAYIPEFACLVERFVENSADRELGGDSMLSYICRKTAELLEMMSDEPLRQSQALYWYKKVVDVARGGTLGRSILANR
jgi:hypothetical protein